MRLQNFNQFIAALALCAGVRQCASAAWDDVPDFKSAVLPILRKHCFACHDGRKQTASLRLDVRSKATRGGESKRAGIVPGKAESSEIHRRLVTPDDDLRMPAEADRLPNTDIATIRRWIDAGAAWPDELANEAIGAGHWAFQPPARPAVPKVRRTDWLRNPIDAFILERLERESMAPSSEADAATLCRRLHLDLTGLPPAPSVVADFVKEYRAAHAADAQSPQQKRTAADAVLAGLVDRLLASPHYGERWGRLWLDAARYADSDGFEKDKPRFVWAYRDWVIDAFNRDLPYDHFVVEQLAGDLLPGATQDQVVATGFLRNSMINEEGGVDPEQFRMEAMFDRMDAVGKGVLGLTIQCAQCHDHKYDPLSQLDYYRMFAFLNNADEANVAVYSRSERTQRDDVLRRIRAAESEWRRQFPDWPTRMASWEKHAADKATAQRTAGKTWSILKVSIPEESTGGSKYLPQADGSFLAQGYAPTKHRVHLIAEVGDVAVAAFRLELLNDPNLPRGGPGRSIEGTAALTEFEVEAAPADNPKKSQKLKIARASADVTILEQIIKPYYKDKSDKRRVLGPIAFAIDGKDETAWGIDVDPGRRNLPRNAVFVLEKPVRNPKGTVFHVYLKQNHGGWNSDDNQNHNLGRFRMSVSADENAEADSMPAAVRAILAIPQARRSPEQMDAVFSHWRTTAAECRPLNERIDALWKQHPEGATQLTLAERKDVRTTRVLKRGDFLKPGVAVEPGVPAFLHGWPVNQPRNRLGFAHWLVDRRSPTTARAIVNRLWQAYFGTGLVASSEDLGTQCESPSHPELLDWLALELMSPSTYDAGGQPGEQAKSAAWSLKRLHRMIALSATYRQNSSTSSDLIAKDPTNRLLARASRLRVDAETVRDIALSASGLLHAKIGGPSVFPPLPGFLVLPPASYGPKVWIESSGADRYRRAMYTFRFRSVPYPALQNFDSPNGDFACVRRNKSNTPLQALTAMNEPIFVECAQGLAARILREAPTNDRQRIELGFQICTSRRPNEQEVAKLAQLLDSERKQFAGRQAAAKDLVGDARRFGAKTSAQDAAAWVACARVLLNLDETMTKE